MRFPDTWQTWIQHPSHCSIFCCLSHSSKKVYWEDDPLKRALSEIYLSLNRNNSTPFVDQYLSIVSIFSTKFLKSLRLKYSNFISDPQVPNLYLIPSAVSYYEQNTYPEASPKTYNTMLTDFPRNSLGGGSYPSNNCLRSLRSVFNIGKIVTLRGNCCWFLQKYSFLATFTASKPDLRSIMMILPTYLLCHFQPSIPCVVILTPPPWLSLTLQILPRFQVSFPFRYFGIFGL